MKRTVHGFCNAIVYLLLLFTTLRAAPLRNIDADNENCQKCHTSHSGLLHYVPDPSRLSEGYWVNAVLHCDTLNVTHGNTVVRLYEVSRINTPLLMLPASHLCFLVESSSHDNPAILCSSNKNCRDEWWKAITRSVLCSHHGTPVRHEIGGDSVIEEEEELVEERVVSNPKQSGINIKFSDISGMFCFSIISTEIMASEIPLIKMS